MVDRIASFSHSNYLLAQTMRLQSDYNNAQIQSSSGLKSQHYQDISQSANRIFNAEASKKILNAQNNAITSTTTDLQQLYDMMNNVQNLIDSTLSYLSGAISDVNNAENMTEKANDTLQELVSLLNTQNGGRYLLSGTATDQTPLDLQDPDYLVQTSPSTVDSSYYQGSMTLRSIRIDNDVTFSYGVTANDPAFEKVLRGLNLLINNPGDDAAYEEAYDLLKQSSNAASIITASLSSQTSYLNNVADSNTRQIDLLSTMVDDAQNVDIASVSVKITQYETQIEASYAVMAKLLNLSLTDYL